MYYIRIHTLKPITFTHTQSHSTADRSNSYTDFDYSLLRWLSCNCVFGSAARVSVCSACLLFRLIVQFLASSISLIGLVFVVVHRFIRVYCVVSCLCSPRFFVCCVCFATLLAQSSQRKNPIQCYWMTVLSTFSVCRIRQAFDPHIHTDRLCSWQSTMGFGCICAFRRRSICVCVSEPCLVRFCLLCLGHTLCMIVCVCVQEHSILWSDNNLVFGREDIPFDRSTKRFLWCVCYRLLLWLCMHAFGSYQRENVLWPRCAVLLRVLHRMHVTMAVCMCERECGCFLHYSRYVWLCDWASHSRHEPGNCNCYAIPKQSDE